MAQRSLPWDGTTTGDAGDYTGAEWQENQRHAIGLGAAYDASSGVLWGSDLLDTSKRGLDVEAQSPVAAAVNLRPGSAVVNGVLYINDAVLALAVAANASGNPRIDSVILRKDTAAQTVRAVVKQGTPAATPVAPTLTQTAGTWETPIADISVANGFVSLAQSTIQPTAAPRNQSDGLYHVALNNSGGTLKTGDVVIWDTTTQRAVTTTTVASDTRAAGVWVGTTANGSYGRVLYRGIGLVRTDAAVTRGQVLRTSATVKQAGRAGVVSYATANAGLKPFAYALETTLATGLALCYVDCPFPPIEPISMRAAGGGLTTSSGVYVTLATTGALVTTGLDLFAEFSLTYFDSGITFTNFTLLSLALFENGSNVSPEWNGATTRMVRQVCNEGRRTVTFAARRVAIPAPGSSITFDLRWMISAGTVTAEEYNLRIYEKA